MMIAELYAYDLAYALAGAIKYVPEGIDRRAAIDLLLEFVDDYNTEYAGRENVIFLLDWLDADQRYTPDYPETAIL